MPKPSDYVVLVRPLVESEGGGYLAVVPDLPGCMSGGDTPEQAFTNVQDAIAEWCATAVDMGRPVPDPSPPELFELLHSATGTNMTDGIRIIKHEAAPNCGSYEVRFADGRESRFFYWDDVPGRRLREGLLTGKQAFEQARTLALAERDKGG
jgi:antitoxin HicB